PEIADNDRPKAVDRIIEVTSQVVRYASPYKKDALALLKKYRPSSAMRAEEVGRLSYDDAIAKAEDAIGTQEWDRAIALLQAAIRKAEAARSIEKVNRARHDLVYCYYRTNRDYESYVLADHLVHRYPQAGLSPVDAEIAMQALADAYNGTEIDR